MPGVEGSKEEASKGGQGRADDERSGVSIRRAGLQPRVREPLENGKQRMEGGESALGCASLAPGA